VAGALDTWPDIPFRQTPQQGKNPPDGAVIDYYLKSDVKREITLKFATSTAAQSVATPSTAPPAQKTSPNVPEYWFAPPDVLASSGVCIDLFGTCNGPIPYAALWLLRPAARLPEYTVPDHAIAGRHTLSPPDHLCAGNYEVVLTVDGQSYRQPLVVSSIRAYTIAIRTFSLNQSGQADSQMGMEFEL